MRKTQPTCDRPSADSERRDFVTLGIAVAAIILFVGTAGAVLPGILRGWLGYSTSASNAGLTSALILNIALIIFGWRRHRELSEEIVERRAAEQEALALARIDPLTGCLNRGSVIDAIRLTAADAEAAGHGLALIMIDLDDFKRINDLHGHLVGDEVLVSVADRIRALLPAGGSIARPGGDEFAVVSVFDRGLPDRVDQLASRIIAEVSTPQTYDGSEVSITMSVGIAVYLPNRTKRSADCQPEELMKQADIAMYNAKAEGKNRHSWFAEEMEREFRRRSQLEEGIRLGLNRGEFSPHYEQQIDLETGRLVGFEMLARWTSPTLGSISPEVFIPITEEMGLIGELSESLMREAFADALEWDASLTLSVNISPVQLRDPWFAHRILKLLLETGFPGERFEIEITENCLHENIGVVRSMITSLQNQGIQISLDDFGTGYSSLAQLRSLPFDRLKIDRSFVMELSRLDANSEIVQAIVTLGKGLKMPVTAEGIEDARILNLLKTVGGMKGQGYLYGRPEPADAVRERLASAGLLTSSAGKRDKGAVASKTQIAAPAASRQAGVHQQA
ncbi:EAL domain-containing protein [Erythrobacter sp. LQ02-29]|uniref:putative bifunctional diguanylate cyclase/phosphodiesterase n=1 Tax=Erythrobacter sp. LQ02-29 TaxID=2920384 RepID=UPI001F4E8183|nr:EAL domain-containing protein [Erythrobacter sp. LQ02-29]MCP9223578.1 EAL domain-containing protein [Erythrobacter sp. LQ02-29]